MLNWTGWGRKRNELVNDTRSAVMDMMLVSLSLAMIECDSKGIIESADPHVKSDVALAVCGELFMNIRGLDWFWVKWFSKKHLLIRDQSHTPRSTDSLINNIITRTKNKVRMICACVNSTFIFFITTGPTELMGWRRRRQRVIQSHRTCCD